MATDHPSTPAQTAPDADVREPALPEAPLVAELKRERDDLQDRFLRKAAEFENYRRRVERERREQADQTVLGLLEELLTVLDDFDLALNVEHGPAESAYRKGIELIHAKLHDVLRKYGVAGFDALGADFDPNRHEAVMYEAGSGRRDGEVIEELRRGYMLGDRLLRPAMVKVAKA
ncbi:MAG: nucleotide exchange factor GrpE [Acidobacteria bacterium]|nr:nucleotide exchange factor GrpE [Acidobacteriota bacterium]